MPVGAAVGIVGGSLVSGAMSSSASKKAGQTVANATDQAALLENQRFQQMLALSMPGYQRAEDAATLYSAALGIPSRPMTQPQSYQTGQPGASVSYGGNGVVGATGWGGGMTGNRFLDGYETQQDAMPQYAPADPNAPQINGGPGVGYTSPTTFQGPGLMTGQPDIGALVRATPGYQHQLDAGIKSLDRAAPLVGGMYSGRRLKALNDYGQSTFGSYYQDWLSKVGGLAGQAQTISSNIGAQGAASAANQGNLMVQGANARANGQMSSANAWGSAIGSAAGGIGFLGGQAGWFKP